MIPTKQSALNPNIGTKEAGEEVRCLDLDEDKPLPDELSVGSKSYDDFK